MKKKIITKAATLLIPIALASCSSFQGTREISQEKGIRLKTLLRKNNSTTPDQNLPKGTKIFLK